MLYFINQIWASMYFH